MQICFQVINGKCSDHCEKMRLSSLVDGMLLFPYYFCGLKMVDYLLSRRLLENKSSLAMLHI